MSQKKFYVGIKNEASTNTVELYFTDYIYDGLDWNTWEYKNMVQDTINQVKAANPSKIKVTINSLGGDVMVGLALYNFLKTYNAEKEVHVIGFAASIASIIAMCATSGKLHMAKNSFMIIHAAWSYTSGNAADMRQQAENLDKVSNELADIYAQRSGKEASYFTDLWANGDYWMTASEAKELGLADVLTADVVSANASLDFSGFRNVPAQLMASVQPEAKNISTLINEGFMKIKDTLTGLFNSAKENKDTDHIANKQEVLDLVNSILTPFAEVMDEALEEVKKPAAETTETPAAPAVEETVVETPEEEAPAEPTELEKLKAEFELFKTQVANASTRPQPAKTAASVADTVVNAEYQS